jgi:prevent-host-death family protein
VIGCLAAFINMTDMLVTIGRDTLMQIAIAEAKAQFAELVRRAEAGEAIELTRYGRPVARIVAADQPIGRPLIGALEGAFTLPDDLFSGDEEITEMFEKSARR